MTMTSPDTPPSTGPYAQAAPAYWSAGWRGLLPLPARAKKHPPTGFTGTGADPSWPDVQTWVDGDEGAGNIALRLPADIIGIDVDAYDGKPARLVLADLQEQLGPLPGTWRSTSRDDGVSGIRLYRVPPGLRWPGGLGPGIDLLRRGHRYAVVWPSVHPEGRTYRWIDPAGVVLAATVPPVEKIPDLPDAWVARFTGGELATDHPRADLTDPQAATWLAEHGQGGPCRRVEHALAEALTGFDAASSRHDHALHASNRLIWLAAEGHQGATLALGRLRETFLAVTAGDRDGDAAAEWGRMVTGAVRLAAARTDITDASIDPCDDPFAGLTTKENRPCPTATSPTSSHSKNPSKTPSVTLAGPLPSSPAPSTASTTEPDLTSAGTAGSDDIGEASREVSLRIQTGGAFILDIPDAVPAVWGKGESVLWAEGEALTICGAPGVGKTTLTGQVLRARLIGGEVLGLPVQPTSSRVLYLAMDRPRQIARSLRRTLGDLDREVLDEKLRVWPGPPIADVAVHPETLLGLVQLAGADTVIVDSIKDAAIGLSNDEVGAGYNRARQICIAAGVEVLEQHHMVKKGDNGTKPKSLSDLYGSTWIASGAGSVVLLHGVAGDPIVELLHLKQPAEVVGPYKVLHDHEQGTSSIWHRVDLLATVRLTGVSGITAKAAASSLFQTETPSESDVEKARRKLVSLEQAGLVEKVEGFKGGLGGGRPATWRATPETLQPVDNSSGSDHGSDHADHVSHSERSRAITRNHKTPGQSDHGTDHADHGAITFATPSVRGGGRKGVAATSPPRKDDGGRKTTTSPEGKVYDVRTGEIVDEGDS